MSKGFKSKARATGDSFFNKSKRNYDNIKRPPNKNEYFEKLSAESRKSAKILFWQELDFMDALDRFGRGSQNSVILVKKERDEE